MKNSDKNPGEFAFGAVAAAALFSALTLFSGALASSPSCSEFAEGLAVMSAKLNYFSEDAPAQDDETTMPKEEPVKISPRLSRSLISLSGFGGWDSEAAPEEKDEPEEDEQDKTENPSGKIVRKTYTYRTSDTYLELPGGGLIRNCTDIDSGYLLEQCAKKPDFSADTSGMPFVLIMHTHTTECYEDEISDSYGENSVSRTTDLDKSVVAVGEKIADELRAAGIGVIHDETVHDYPRYTGAYDRSAETVKKILEENPTVKIVIDVHRDAIEENGTRYAPAVEINGVSAAQVMMICGCTNVPQYRYNLRIASRLQSKAEGMFPGLTRPILFDERNYNQELTHGSFLIEMGSDSNSLGEALYSGELIGKALAETIREGW